MSARAPFASAQNQGSHTHTSGLFGNIALLGDGDYEELSKTSESTDPLQKLIALQTFEGFWEFDAPLQSVVGVSSQDKLPEGGHHSNMWATILAVTFLEKKLGTEKEAWEMLAEKVKQWLIRAEIEAGNAVQGWWEQAEKLIEGGEA